MKYKMLCIDMDGTLLGKGKKISEENKKAIKSVYEKGVKIIVATGRIYNNAEYYSHILGVKAPVIAANGAVVIDRDNDKVIYDNPIKHDDCLKLIDLLFKMKMFFHFYTLEGIYSNNFLTDMGTKFYMKKQVGCEEFKIQYHVIKDKKMWKEIFKDNIDEISKCIVMSTSPKKIIEFKEKLKDIKGLVNFGSGSRSVEINNIEASKGNAVKALAEYYGIEREEIVAIGDNENDLSMIEYAGFGVAMDNAIDSLKDIADFITSSNKNNGVARALEKIF